MSKPLAAITGASSGLGAVFARKLAARGYDLLLVARRRERLEQLAAELAPVNVEVLPADLAEIEGIETVAARLAGEPRLSLLVNNAGFGTKRRFWQADMPDQIRMHRLHIDAILRLSRAALEGMTARDAGAIINVSSVAGFSRSPGNVSYCATKSWINAFTEGLHLELRSVKSKVTVQSLCPGFTYTEFHDVMGFDRRKIGKGFWMRPEDIVDESLAELASGKLFVIPGWRYKLFVTLFTRIPTGWRLALEARAAHRKDEA